MSLSPGDKLGPYEIIAPIGAGGMGEVYKARDGRLDRVVAIKTSKIAFDHRFEQEARAVAALNHPNICTLHDVGPNYLVMEYVQGAELKGPLPLDRVLALASQILDALDAAHRKGITHRDLKPANVMVTKTGIKVLDFGLAKIAQPEQTDNDITRAAMTQENTMLGTLYYMAPEQLQGKKDVDSRADIFAFGCVLYEMLTGKRAFDGSNAASIIAAVMERPAPSVEAVAPAALDRILKRCLEKDPDDRWQNARDVKSALELTQLPASAVPGPAKRSGWGMAAAAAVIVAAIGVGWGLRRQSPAEAAPVRASLLPPPGSDFANPFVGYAVSPDGRLLVFSAQKKDAPHPTLWLRPLNALTATELPGTENGNGVFWSPDSRSIGFIADDKLKRMDVSGGPIQILCDASGYEGGSWSTEGVILFGSTQEGLRRIPATGGTPQQVTTPTTGSMGNSLGTRYPHFLPDGRHFLYTSADPPGNAGKIFLGSIDDPTQRVRLADSDAKAEYAPPRNGRPGYLLWVRNQTLVAQPFDGQSKLLKGDPLPVAEDLFTGFITTGRRAAYSVSHSGALVYRTGASGFQILAWIDRDGKAEALTGATSDPRAGDPAISPDGRRVALERQIGTNFDVWIYELARGVMTRLTFDPGIDWIPVWSPDSSEVIYGSTRKSGVGLYRRAASGEGQDELLLTGSIVPSSWSRDGRFLLYNQQNDIWVLPLTGNREERKPVAYLHSPFRKFNAQFSPDGKWVAYASDESGRSEIYIQAFPISGGKWQVTNSGGTQPRWRGDGKELFFLSDFKLWAAGVRATPGRVEIDPPRGLFVLQVGAGPQYVYDVKPDGQRFIVRQPPNINDAFQPMNVISDWQAGLKTGR